MKKLKSWLNDFFDFSYREIEEENLRKFLKVHTRNCLGKNANNPALVDMMTNMTGVLNYHLNVEMYRDKNWKWLKPYYDVWWNFNKTQCKISPIYDLCSIDFDAEKYYDALCKYVIEHESELNKQPFIERLKTILCATIRIYF